MRGRSGLAPRLMVAWLAVATGASCSATPPPADDPRIGAASRPTVPIRDRFARARFDMLTAINADREEVGAAPVVLDSVATIGAQIHAEAMAAENFFSHYDRHGRTPYQRMSASGSTSHVRENIFRRQMYGGAGGPQVDPWPDFDIREAEEWLMASAGHRETILDPTRTGVGIGIAVNRATTTIVVVQEFVASHATLAVPERVWRLAETPVRGRITTAGLRPLALVLRRQPRTPPWVDGGEPPGGAYRDGEGPARMLAPWDIRWRRDGSFEADLSFDTLTEAGPHYGILYVAPYEVVESALARRGFTTSDGWPGAAFMIDVF